MTVPGMIALRRQLLAKGYPPLPIRGKAPRWKGWAAGEITPERLSAIEASYPDHTNTGIRTGRCAAIDIDLTNAAHVIEVQKVIDAVLGTTPLTRIGSKGALHCYRNDNPISKITIGLKDKRLIEILGAGQQFAAYGDHPDTGKPYQWPNDFFGGDPLQTPLAELPLITPDQLFAVARELCAKLKALGYGAVTVSGAEQDADAPKPSVASGVPVTAEIIDAMLRAIPPSCDRGQWLTVSGGLNNAPVTDPNFDGLALFTAWSRGDLHGGATPANFNGEDDCANEWQRDEHKRANGEAVPAFGALVLLAREHGYDGPSQAFSAAETFAKFADTAQPTSPKTPRNKFRVLRPADMRELPEPSYLIGNILPANAITMIVGPPASFKTFIALELAFQIATGKSTEMGFVAQGAVAYCAGEAPIGIARKRFPAWMQQRGIADTDAVPFALVPAVPLVSTAEDVDALIEALTATKLRYSLIVIDTVARALGGLDENSAKDAGLLLDAAGRLRDTFDCSVLLIHHTGKDEGRGARGSSALIAGVDASYEVKLDAEALVVSLRCKKMKDADPPDTIRLKGKHAYGSIVFDPIKEADFAALTRSNTSVHRLDVAAALKGLRAVNGTTVTTQVLATSLAGPEAPPDIVESKVRALQRSAKDRLRAYVSQLGEGRGHATLWTMPTPDIDGRLK
jgi:hypothetical protein